MDDKAKKNIVFNGTKKETYTSSNGFKKLSRRLKSNFSVSTNKDEVSRDRLTEFGLIIFGGPREGFTPNEFSDLKAWLNAGGRALFMLNDGGEKASGCNLNRFLEDYGVCNNSDSVLRSVHYKYYHPKEVFISDGVLVPDISRKKNSVSFSGVKPKGSNRPEDKGGRLGYNKFSSSGNNSSDKLSFVYPYGCTITVHKPSRPILSTGPISYPMNRPIASIWESETVNEIGGKRGRFIVIGSTEMFSDDWIDKDENSKLCDVLFSWLLDFTEVDMMTDRREDNLTTEFTAVPNIETLSESIKPCLQGLEDLPVDFTKLFDLNVHKFDLNHISDVVNMYKTLYIPHQPITLIAPQFECPLPKMFPSTFPPTMKELPPPALDLFDLDENFAQNEIRLAQLTNKCTNGLEDLEYYISESGNILNVMTQLNHGERSAKHILFYIFKQIVDFKKSNYGTAEMSNNNDDAVFKDSYDIGDESKFNNNNFVNNNFVNNMQQPIQLNPTKLVDLAPMNLSNPKLLPDVGRGQKIGFAKLTDNDYHK